MSRLISLNRQVTPVAARHEWHVANDGHPLKRMEPAALLEQVGALASELVGPGLVVTGVERLVVFAPIRPGDRLVATAALEPIRHRRHAVSVVVRNDQTVVVAGVLTFVPEGESIELSVAQRHRVRSGARDGKALVETIFHARTTGNDWVLKGNPLEWVHASALLSAQGFIGGPADFVGLQAISRLGPVAAGESLVLQCSVVYAADDLVSVLSHVRTETERRDVLWAVSSFRATEGVVPVLQRQWPNWLPVARP